MLDVDRTNTAKRVEICELLGAGRRMGRGAQPTPLNARVLAVGITQELSPSWLEQVRKYLDFSSPRI